MHFGSQRNPRPFLGRGLYVFEAEGEFCGDKLLVELHKTPGIHNPESLSRGKVHLPFFFSAGDKLTDLLESQTLDRERDNFTGHGILDPGQHLVVSNFYSLAVSCYSVWITGL